MCLAIVLIAGAAQAAGKPVEPPPEWAAYYAAVRKADVIEDDEARCRAYPDLPGVGWAAGVGSGRCSILREPMLSLDQLQALLEQPDGATELERRHAALLDAHYDDPAQREQIFVAFAPFDESARAKEVADRWLAVAPSSPYALAAAGTQRMAMAWQARGTGYASTIAREDRARMHRYMQEAAPYFVESLEREARLSPACVGLASMMRMVASHEDWQAMVARCVDRDPVSYLTVLEWYEGATPKWGGSMEELRSMVAYAMAHIAQNPSLGSFGGELAAVVPVRQSGDDPVAAQPGLVAAARMGPSASIMAQAAYALSKAGDRWGSFAYDSQAIRYRPANDVTRSNRALKLRRFGDDAWALRDLRVAAQAEPGDLDYVYRIGQVLRELEGEAAALPYFKRAMQSSDPEHRLQATEMYCQGLVMAGPQAEADSCTQRMVQDHAEHGETWRLRSLALMQQHDDGVRLRPAVENFLRYADPDLPHHADELPRMRELLEAMKTGDAK
jgi:tetratricopeptide (TPR) repeat protein